MTTLSDDGGWRVLVVANPRAGTTGPGVVADVLERLRPRDPSPALHRTTAAGSATAAVADAADDVDLVVVVGGDGTVREVVDGLLLVERRRRALAVVPAPEQALRLEVHETIDALDPAEWDRLLGDRGSFTADGLRFLEATFADGERPEDRWTFRYYVVRDATGAPVLATFFTGALWKDDMLSPAAVSARVEELRRDDPYALTSMTYAMGSLLTEGDHLFLDRSADWRGALTLLLDESGAEQERVGATVLALRDLDDGDPELEAFLTERGLVRFPMLASHAVELDHADDAE